MARNVWVNRYYGSYRYPYRNWEREIVEVDGGAFEEHIMIEVTRDPSEAHRQEPVKTLFDRDPRFEYTDSEDYSDDEPHYGIGYIPGPEDRLRSSAEKKRARAALRGVHVCAAPWCGEDPGQRARLQPKAERKD